MNIANDRRLIILMAKGDQDAFGELTRRHQYVVFNIAYRMLGNRRDAEDAAQEAFIRTYCAMDTFDTARPFSPWLKRIAINICLNRLTKDRPSHTLDDNLPSLQESGPGPEAQTENHERNLQIRKAVLSLSPNFRAVIELQHFQGLSYEEISETLDRPISSVKSDLFRARRILGQKLKDLEKNNYDRKFNDPPD